MFHLVSNQTVTEDEDPEFHATDLSVEDDDKDWPRQYNDALRDANEKLTEERDDRDSSDESASTKPVFGDRGSRRNNPNSSTNSDRR